MRIQVGMKFLAAAAATAILSACGGGGVGFGTNSGTGTPGTPGTPAPGSTISVNSLKLLSSGKALPSDADTAAQGITLRVIATDANSNAIAGLPIAFTATSGNLINGSSVTDSTGTATATLTTGGDSTKRTIKVNASGGNKNASPELDIDVVAPNNPAVLAPALGNVNSTGVFTDQAIAVGQSALAASGSTGLHLDLVDQNNTDALIASQNPTVTFSSPCISLNQASITSPVTIFGGSANSTYVAKGCSGSDIITATTSINGKTLTATGQVTVAASSLGSVQFISATPTTIGLQGSGQQETSVVVFQVSNQSGGPVANKCIFFSLNSTVGGLNISPISAKTDASGNAQTTVNSGSVHTTVRVTADVFTAADANSNSCPATPPAGQKITSQSAQLVVSTAIPDQNSFSISFSPLNLEGDSIDGVPSTVTLRLSDRFNNPVPDGTAVALTAEGGSIDPKCTTTNGICTVTFTSQNPRTSQLSTIAAVKSDNNCSGANTVASGAIAGGNTTTLSAGTVPAVGAQFIFQGGTVETLQVASVAGQVLTFASNLANAHANGSAVTWASPHKLGCDDHRYSILATAIGEESFIDSNGNGKYDSGEPFGDLAEGFVDSNEDGIFTPTSETPGTGDFNSNGVHDGPSGNFTGVLCNSGCDTSRSLNVLAKGVVVMSSSDAVVNIQPSCVALGVSGSAAFDVFVSDTAGQPMAAGTTIAAATTYGAVNDPASFTQADSTSFGGFHYIFLLTGPATAGSGGKFTASVTSPHGLITAVRADVKPNDAGCKTVGFNAGNSTALSTGGGAQQATLTVNLSSSSTDDVSVPYTVGGTAAAKVTSTVVSSGTSGVGSGSGTLVIPSGSTTGTIKLNYSGVVSGETVTVTLGSSNASVNGSARQAVLTAP